MGSILLQPTGPPGKGIAPTTLTATFINRTGGATVVGEPYVLDLAASDGDVSTFRPGPDTSIWANVIDAGSVVAGTLTICVVALEAVADNAEFQACYFGFCDALIIDDTDSVAVGDPLALIAGSFDAEPAVDQPVFAFALEALTTPTTATLGAIFLHNGFIGAGSTAPAAYT